MTNTTDWMIFQRIFGCGTTRAQQVLDAVQRPENLLGLPQSDACALGLTQRELVLLGQRAQLAEEAEVAWLAAQKLGCQVLTLDSGDYPTRLRDIYSPPLVLYVLGDIEGLDDQPTIGMVGTRKYTAYGKRVAADLSTQLVGLGFAIVSGMALGIDTISHTAALHAGGRTIAVLGNGLNQVYPPANLGLRDLILQNGGAVVSEFPPGEAPLAFHFPIRNRIISGLSLGVVVVEGTRHSGSLSTAGHAVTQDREVFAVPGEIYSPMSAATNWLISQGAAMATCADDIAVQFPYLHLGKTHKMAKKQEPAQISFDIPVTCVYNEQGKELPGYLSENQRRVMEQLGSTPATSDAIAVATGLAIPAILSSLTQLELFGLVEACAGRRFVRK